MLKKPTSIKKETAPIFQKPKYERPKVLVIDLSKEALEALRGIGYNASDATFGTPYRVLKGSHYEPVIVKPSLPNYTEQEIIIVDLGPSKTAERAEGQKSTPDDELDWWAKCSRGLIDPRPRAMAMVQDSFDRILKNGGVFVIFADMRNSQELVYAQSRKHSGFQVAAKIPFDNWSMLSILSN